MMISKMQLLSAWTLRKYEPLMSSAARSGSYFRVLQCWLWFLVKGLDLLSSEAAQNFLALEVEEQVLPPLFAGMPASVPPTGIGKGRGKWARSVEETLQTSPLLHRSASLPSFSSPRRWRKKRRRSGK